MQGNEILDVFQTVNQGATSLNSKTLAQVNSMNVELHNADGSLAGKYTLSQFLENVIYTFLSTTKASDLASVLGGVNLTKYTEEIDLNTFNMSGVFFLAKARCTNAPTNVNDGLFINYYDSQVGAQIWISTALNTSNYGMFVRAKSSGTWKSWLRVTLTA